MKERRKRDASVWRGGRGAVRKGLPYLSPFALLFALVVSALFITVVFSTFRIFGVTFRPVLIPAWPTATMNSISTEFLPSSDNPSITSFPSIQLQHAISLPDQILLIPKLPLSNPNPNPNLHCLYFPPPSSPSSLSSSPSLLLPPLFVSSSLIRCPLAPQGFSLSLSHSDIPPIRPYQWDRLAYSALIDARDNSTLVFAKGFNHRPARLSDPSRYECLFGWDLSKPRYLLSAPAISVAQEIFRCKTPLSILLQNPNSVHDPPLVSVKTRGRGSVTLPSVARPEFLSPPHRRRRWKMESSICICTMVRNQARFLREWILYHSKIGIQRYFIYDNNSDDGIKRVVDSLLDESDYNITLHPWPWVKTQEAGFAHCALRARDSCDWVGFIDVDEFLYFPSKITLQDVLKNYTRKSWVGELRTSCHSFGPSGRTKIPLEGVMVGYTCRMNAPERHKSIVRPEALNPSLINVVHHFHLKDGMRYVNIGQGVMVINHYKYQVWEVFKEKFYRRVATYVADWQDEENVGSKDRAPGLGTKPVEPRDWPNRFCEVNDTGLRDWVIRVFTNRETGELPW